MGAFVSDFEKIDFETKILYIIEKVENWFFSEATLFSFSKKAENGFFWDSVDF